jgi:hypothetical protein
MGCYFMPQLYQASSERLEIIYQSDLQILFGRWLRPVTETEARQDYATLLAAAQHFGAHHWLFDIRRRGRSDPATLAWLLDVYYSQAVHTLGPPLRLVYFMAPGLRQEFQADGIVPELASYAANQAFRLNQSITEGEAVNWLLSEQKTS